MPPWSSWPKRASTILDAEQIIVLDGGRIAGIGTHPELMVGCQAYRKSSASQLGWGASRERADGAGERRPAATAVLPRLIALCPVPNGPDW